MNYKLNIIEPWESGTESAIDAKIIKKTGMQFLLFTERIVSVRKENAQIFVCELKNQKDKNAFESHVKGVYPIHMVFDKNIQNIDNELHDLGTYRSNFLSGEIIVQ